MNLPQDFKERMKLQLGESYGDFLACYENDRVCGLRYNPLKIEKEQLVQALLKHGIPLEEVEWAGEGFYYPADAQPGRLPLHEAGAYYIQEPSAMITAELLEPKPGEKILDLCAAPGGKSTQIAGRMQGRGLLVSNETVAARAKTLSRNIERMGIVNAVVLNETPKHLAACFPAYFDRIVTDAPCSGEGMFRKTPAACGEWSLQQVAACANRQREILAQAVQMLRPGGVLVYSTCTFSTEENEKMMEWLVHEYPQFTLERSEHIWPHRQRGEGHYAARLRKAESVSAKDAKRILAEEAFVPDGREKSISKNANKKGTPFKEFLEFCQDTLSPELAEWMEGQVQAQAVHVFADQLCLMPCEPGILDRLKVERAGLQLGHSKKNRFEPSHALAMALHPEDVKRAVELKEPERYLRGDTAVCSGLAGWTLAIVEGCSAGWGKAVQGVLKNHYPKGLRRGNI